MNIYNNHSLLPYHTFGMDVKAAVFIEYDSVNELKQVLQRENLSEGQWLHIGGGSNLLFSVLFIAVTFFGGVINAGSVLIISDIFNAIMLITNLVALLLLTRQAKSN